MLIYDSSGFTFDDIRVTYDGVLLLTDSEKLDLIISMLAAQPSAILAAAQITPMHVDVRKMNNAAVLGDGSAGNLWRGA